MNGLEELLPHFGARAAQLVASTSTEERVYIRVRTGRTRTTMKSLGRYDLVGGETPDPHAMVQGIEQLIADGGSEFGHLLELMHYDPNGRVSSPLHTVLVPASPEARTAESFNQLENGETVKACISALISMAQSADARADRSQEKTLQLMEAIADRRVNETRLEAVIAAGAPAEDSRIVAARQFAELIGPVMPVIKRRMEEAHQAKNKGNAPTPEPDEVDTIDAAATNGEMADVLLEHLSNLSTVEPGIWDDPARSGAALSIFTAVRGEGATVPDPNKPAADAIPELTPGE